ncbi:hypothetical protein F5Y19DRAFT_118203 [Xylariaceae sp. FL1651]|nr:hypothetical protein F5Y19DRAFT_118203 [Xylariaceae sp. FL1651]
MDDTTRLVSELLNKLAELDQKVYDYRQDMAQEFRRYSHRLLHDVPKDVSARVGQILAGELLNYPALSPGLELEPSSPYLHDFADDRRARRGRGSPPPVLPHTSGVPPNDTTYNPPHDREREFHGVFTPSYLPLLEAVQPSKPVSTSTTISSPIAPQGKEANIIQNLSSHGQLKPIEQRPNPVRRLTGETTSSITSDDSVSHTRRSALRRSSSTSTKGNFSPRRVRFDVEGEEVLPTVSPPMSPRTSDLVTSSPPEDKLTSLQSPLNHLACEQEGSGLLDNSPPRPKKISSTERLKAMARSSTEDTSNWTVVGELHDDDEEEEVLVMSSSKRRSKVPILNPAAGAGLNDEKDYQHSTLDEQSTGQANKVDECRIIGGDDATNDLLEMHPLSSFKNRKKFSLPEDTIFEVETEGSGLLEAAPTKIIMPNEAFRSQSNNDQAFDEEDMFEFETEPNEKSASQTRAMKETSKYIEDEEAKEGEEQSTSMADNTAREQFILYSASPAVPIAKPTNPPPASPTSSTSAVSKQIDASAGSYKGRPFIIGVVRNEELLKKAAEMGDFSSFVGSVDGRSGVDASNSYRQEPNFFNGTPRSLGERLMEESHALRNADKASKEE